MIHSAHSQSITEASVQPTLADALSRINLLEAEVAGLRESTLFELTEAVGPPNLGGAMSASSWCEPEVDRASHYAIYEKGWTIRPYDSKNTPFEIKTELHNQFRYTLFDRSDANVPDAAGNDRTIPDRNDFNINRGRLVFSGFAFDKDLEFYANIDYSTVASRSIQPLLSWISFRFDERTKLYMGLGKVPGTWEWQQTSRYTMGADRSLATTFFRPSISTGVWLTRQPTDNLNYTLFVGNGFNTLTLRSSDLDTNLAYSAIAWWEPLADFGAGFSDVEPHDELAIRLGHGLTQTRNDSTVSDEPGAEETVIRLSDGTRLVTPGALAPGVTVNAFDIWLYTVHGGLKKNGFSLSTELFFRWLNNLDGTGGVSLDSQFDTGFFVQGGAFLIPKKLEVFARGSQVSGDFGTGDEVSVGTNWYLFGERSARATFDITSISDSPAEQSRTGYIAGGSGTLVRAQLWTFF